MFGNNDTKDEKLERREAFKERIYSIMFETTTPQGKKFDLYLLGFILFSLLILMIESIPTLSEEAKSFFYYAELILSSIFTLEYLMRIYASPKKMRYILSVWGIIDLLAVLPILLIPFSSQVQYFRIIRILRLIRIFKIFRISKFTREAYSLYYSLTSSIYKIAVFMFFVLIISIIIGGLMFVVEGGHNEGFESIPKSIYWAIVTITTVGFGDVTPSSDLGKFFATIMMLLGYAIIAVPTGIVSMEMFRQLDKNLVKCKECNHPNEPESAFCSACGTSIKKQTR